MSAASSTSPLQPTLNQEPGLSEPQRLANVFFSPSKTFADIRRNASWWAPWLILSIVSLGFNVLLDKKIGYDQISENQMKLNPKAQERMEQLSPEQQQQRIHASGNFFRYVFGYGAPVTSLIFLVIVAAVLLATFNFGLGTELTFKQALAVTSYAFLIRLVYVVLLSAAVLANSDPSAFNISNPVATNPAFFFSFSDTPRFLYSLMANFDVLTLWLYAVLGIGFAVVGKKKPATGVAVMAGWWVVVTLCSAGLAAAFS
jgi:Yip1 domain